MAVLVEGVGEFGSGLGDVQYLLKFHVILLSFVLDRVRLVIATYIRVVYRLKRQVVKKYCDIFFTTLLGHGARIVAKTSRTLGRKRPFEQNRRLCLNKWGCRCIGEEPAGHGEPRGRKTWSWRMDRTSIGAYAEAYAALLARQAAASWRAPATAASAGGETLVA